MEVIVRAGASAVCYMYVGIEDLVGDNQGERHIPYAGKATFQMTSRGAKRL